MRALHLAAISGPALLSHEPCLWNSLGVKLHLEPCSEGQIREMSILNLASFSLCAAYEYKGTIATRVEATCAGQL
jgi:hypothetical protein